LLLQSTTQGVGKPLSAKLRDATKKLSTILGHALLWLVLIAFRVGPFACFILLLVTAIVPHTESRGTGMDAAVDSLTAHCQTLVFACKSAGIPDIELDVALKLGVALCAIDHEKGTPQYFDCGADILLSMLAQYSCAKLLIRMADADYADASSHDPLSIAFNMGGDPFRSYRKAGLTYDSMDAMWEAALQTRTASYPEETRLRLVAGAGKPSFDQAGPGWTHHGSR